jgi:alpha-beta hydrolase superfamily lysophospholipase
MDFHVELKNGQMLKGIIRTPGENAAALIIFIHGLGEHIHRYDHWSDMFLRENIAFAGLDLPGHGRSEGRRGMVKSYSVLHEMITVLLETAGKTFPGVPVWLYGHSMGGAIVLDYVLKFNPSIKGAIVTSPWLRLAFAPSRLKVLLAKGINRIFPGLIQANGLNTIHLSHDETIIEKYNNDPLVHDRISVSLFAGTMKAAAYVLRHASDLKVPVLIVHGSMDKICSPEGSREFAEKTPLAELMIWNGGFHELHNEPFSHDVFRYIADWIKMKRKK